MKMYVILNVCILKRPPIKIEDKISNYLYPCVNTIFQKK